jgi:hypothetical protein
MAEGEALRNYRLMRTATEDLRSALRAKDEDKVETLAIYLAGWLDQTIEEKTNKPWWNRVLVFAPIVVFVVIWVLKADISDSVWPDRVMDGFAFLMAVFVATYLSDGS